VGEAGARIAGAPGPRNATARSQLTCSSKLRRSKLKPLPVTTALRMSRGPPRKFENWVSMMDTLLARDSGITLTTLDCCDLPAVPVSCQDRSKCLEAPADLSNHLHELGTGEVTHHWLASPRTQPCPACSQDVHTPCRTTSETTNHKKSRVVC
jgi:hypothetical protein